MSADVEWNGDELLATIKEATKEGLRLSGEIILAASLRIVPYASGELASTGTVTDIEDSEAPGVEISFSGPYAVIQHEDETLRHPDPTNPLSLGGRTAKYLENTATENADKVAELVAATIEAAIG